MHCICDFIMTLKEYGLEILLSTLGIPDFYRSYIQSQDAKLELIAKYLKGDLFDRTSQAPLKPKVNFLIEEIEQVLYENLPPHIPYIKKWYWPNWNEYALCISHDVDKLSESRSHIWKIRKRFSMFTVLKALLGISNPYNNLKEYLKFENQYGVHSSFYFLAEEYDFSKISQELQLLNENKMDLGLHGGFGTHSDAKKLNDEKTKLEKILKQPIFGTRQHFLKFELPETWNVHNRTDLLYDTTVGFNDKIGFKLGFAFPFFTPDAHLNPSPLIELPLLIMDAAMWTHLKHTEETALNTILEFRDKIKQFHGLLTVLWHQCTLKMRGGRIYKNLLKRLASKDVYIANGAEVAKWWRGRNDFQIKITTKDNQISIDLQNPKRINDLGIIIKTKKKIKLNSTSSNLRMIEDANNVLKITFHSGESGKIILSEI